MKRPLLSLGFVLACLVRPVEATWSIVCVDTRTREVAVASATCLKNFDLDSATPVLLVGQGAAASQSVIAPTPIMKGLRKGILADMTPHHILAVYQAQDGAQDRQVGIATMTGPAVSWTGSGAMPAKPMRTGKIGSIFYAMQGNLLAGNAVVAEMEDTFVSAQGDLSQKILVAMETARRYGGDGRCSCDQPKAHQCGSPPENYGPEGKSAHTAFMHVTRLGDTNGPCNGSVGCSAGDYYLNIEFNGGVNSDDPVTKLRKKYDEWRAALAGRPDHLLSTITPSAAVLAAGESAGMEVVVRLNDVEGDSLPAGGVQLSAESLTERPSQSVVDSILDNGDGTFTLRVLPGAEPGIDEFAVWADDGIRPVRLHPPLRVNVVTPSELLVGSESVSAARPHTVPLRLDLGGELAGAAYGIVGWTDASAGAFLDFTLRSANTAVLPASFGYLDPSGRAEAAFAPSTLLAQALAGTRIHWAAWTIDAVTGRWGVTSPQPLEVLP